MVAAPAARASAIRSARRVALRPRGVIAIESRGGLSCCSAGFSTANCFYTHLLAAWVEGGSPLLGPVRERVEQYLRLIEPFD